MPYDEMTGMQHRLELEGRERLIVSGVEEVERFDEEEIVMVTTAGTLVVDGANLHIGKLNLDGGELHVDGTIHALVYEDSAPNTGRGGFLRRRLFRLLLCARYCWEGYWGFCTTCCGPSGGWAGSCGEASWMPSMALQPCPLYFSLSWRGMESCASLF